MAVRIEQSDYSWVIRGNGNLVHKRKIAAGGVGEVHEVLFIAAWVYLTIARCMIDNFRRLIMYQEMGLTIRT
jgi:hypothetical protein